MPLNRTIAILIAAFAVAVTTQAQAKYLHPRPQIYKVVDKPPASCMTNEGHYRPCAEPQKSSPVRYSRRGGIQHRKTNSTASAGLETGHGGMVSVPTVFGFNITVHPAFASKFQRFFALLKEHGYKAPANITRCWAPHGTHVPGSNHYIGAACDIQTGWNRGPDFVYHMDGIIKQAGLFSGCAFRDCGHVEAVRGTHNRPPSLYASIEKFKAEQSTARYQP